MAIGLGIRRQVSDFGIFATHCVQLLSGFLSLDGLLRSDNDGRLFGSTSSLQLLCRNRVLVESRFLWLWNEAKMGILWHQIVKIWNIMLRMSSLHRPPLYKISKNGSLEKNDYKTQFFFEITHNILKNCIPNTNTYFSRYLFLEFS